MRALNVFRLGLVGALFAAAGLKAQTEHPQVATGLWEIEVSSHMSGAGIPSGMPVRTTTMHSCATKENVDDMFSSSPDQRSQCVKSNVQVTARKMSMDISCNNGGSTGHMEVVFDSDSSAHSTMHVTALVQGRTLQMDTSTTAKRISSDCGSVHPGHPQPIR